MPVLIGVIKAISGYAFYEVESKDRLVGGWWHKNPVPVEILCYISKIDDCTIEMTDIILERETNYKQFLQLAQNYFEKL